MKKSVAILAGFLSLFGFYAWSQTAVSPVRTISCSAGNFISALTSSGTFTCSTPSGTGINQLTGDVTAGPGVGSQAATIANSSVSNAKLANMANGTVKCRTTAGTGDPEDCSSSQTTALLSYASASTPGIVKLHNVPVTLGWVGGVDPNGAAAAVVNQSSTIASIIGNVETAVGATATVTVYKAPSGTACGSGTALHSGTFNANGTAATNQTLTVTTSTLSAGDRICIQTSNSSNWLAGAGVGSISIHLAPTP